jgi:hypothetical protein
VRRANQALRVPILENRYEIQAPQELRRRSPRNWKLAKLKPLPGRKKPPRVTSFAVSLLCCLERLRRDSKFSRSNSATGVIGRISDDHANSTAFQEYPVTLHSSSHQRAIGPSTATAATCSQLLREGLGTYAVPATPPSTRSPIPHFHYRSKARMIAPAMISEPPKNFVDVSRSPRNMAANTMTNATLNLSTGATRDAGPSCSARK